MPDFANCRRALLCQGEPERVPAVEFHIDAAIKARFLGRPVESIEDDAEFYLRAGYDFVPILFGMRRTMVERAAQAAETGQSAGHMKLSRARYDVNQPRESTRLWAEEGAGLITDRASLDEFDWPDPEAYNYHDVARLGEILPREAKVVPVVGYIFAAGWMLMGFERFCLDLAQGAPIAARVMQRLGELHVAVVERLLEFDCVGAVCMPDDLAYKTSLMVRPAFYREHVFPWHRRIGGLVRRKDLPYVFHSDGRYVDVIDDLIECGYRAIHPCEPASMDIVELKQRYGGRLCLCGNINLDSTLTLGTPEDVDREVRQRIRALAPGGGYCCGSSNSVTEYVPFENYLAMLEATRKYGRYPIRLM